MSHYLLNEASFELPADLKDRSIHQFVINDKGPSEFTFVISRAEDIVETSIEAFADRLENELRKALPKFDMQEKGYRILDGSTAMELNYTWRNGNDWMHQRQIAVLVQSAIPGQIKALLLTGTCVKTFTAHWNEVFEHMLTTFRLRSPLQTPLSTQHDQAQPTLPDHFQLIN